jgi:hypothetical protein
MNTKVFTYAVLAVALGYLLTSVVPSALVPETPPVFLESGEEPLIREAPPESESEVLGDQDLGEEGQSLDVVRSVDDVFQYGYLVLDLFIALGIYFIARRRLA